MTTFLQVVVSGLAVGCIYALVALGFSMVYRALRVINFAQGQVFMVGSYIGLIAFSYVRAAIVLVFAVVLTAAGVIGLLTEHFAFRPLHRAEHYSFVIASIGVGIILENVVRIFFPDPRPFPPVFGERTFDVGGVLINDQHIWIAVSAVTIIVLLQLFFMRTRLGKAMRAVSEDQETASLLGVNVQRSIYLTFALSAAIGAVGGVLIGPLFLVSSDMGNMVGLKAFSAAVLGGIMSVPGTIVGGLVLGVLENLGAMYVSSDYKDAIAFVVLIAMLMVRPSGLLGRPAITKA